MARAGDGANPRGGRVLLEFGAILVLGAIGLGLLIALPFLLVAGLVKFLVMLILLPFRLLGAVFGAITGVLGAVFGGLVSVVSVLGGLLAAVAALLFLPLLPIIALFGLIWLFGRSSRRANA